MIAPSPLPASPERLESPDVISLLVDIRDALNRIAVGQLASAAESATKESKEAKAIRLLVENGQKNVSAIAREVGVCRKTLYNYPAFREALERMRGAATYAPRMPRCVRPDGELVQW